MYVKYKNNYLNSSYKTKFGLPLESFRTFHSTENLKRSKSIHGVFFITLIYFIKSQVNTVYQIKVQVKLKFNLLLCFIKNFVYRHMCLRILIAHSLQIINWIYLKEKNFMTSEFNFKNENFIFRLNQISSRLLRPYALKFPIQNNIQLWCSYRRQRKCDRWLAPSLECALPSRQTLAHLFASQVVDHEIWNAGVIFSAENLV